MEIAKTGHLQTEDDPQSPPVSDFRKLFQSCPTPLLVLNPDSPKFTIVAVTDAYLRATMTKRGEILGRGLFEVFPENPGEVSGDGVLNLRASLERVLETKEPDTMAVQKYDIPRPLSEGGGFEERHWSPINTPVCDAAGSVTQIIHRVEDVTELVKRRETAEANSSAVRRRMEELEFEVSLRSHEIKQKAELLRQLNGELEAFSYTVSHDLRAPLRAIWGFANALDEDYGPKLPASARRYVAEITNGARQMDQLITDLLAYSRLSRSEMPLSHVDLGVVCGEAVRRVGSEIGHLAAAHISLQGDFPTVIANEVTLTQAIINLLTNALKFVKAGQQPRVTIHSEYRGDAVRLYVSDNGLGISPEYQQRIFAPFQRLHGAGEYPGTGIGLAIVSRALSRMEGRVGVESKLGEGSRFWLELPRAEEKVRAA